MLISTIYWSLLEVMDFCTVEQFVFVPFLVKLLVYKENCYVEEFNKLIAVKKYSKFI